MLLTVSIIVDNGTKLSNKLLAISSNITFIQCLLFILSFFSMRHVFLELYNSKSGFIISSHSLIFKFKPILALLGGLTLLTNARMSSFMDTAKLDEYERFLHSIENNFIALTESARHNFKETRNNLNNVDLQYNKINMKSDDVNRKFQEHDQRFASIEHKIDVVVRELKKLGMRLNNVDIRYRNLTMSRLHQKIEPVAMLDEANGELTFPDSKYFPTRVIDFYNLQSKGMGLDHPLQN